MDLEKAVEVAEDLYYRLKLEAHSVRRLTKMLRSTSSFTEVWRISWYIDMYVDSLVTEAVTAVLERLLGKKVCYLECHNCDYSFGVEGYKISLTSCWESP